MTSTVTAMTVKVITAYTYNTLSTTVGVVVIELLFGLLLQKEIIRTLGTPLAKVWMRALDVAVLPLLLAFCVIVSVRFLNLLQ
jgi:hypothetical protein